MISSHFTHKKGPLLSLPYSGVATSVLIRVNSPFFCLDDRPCPEDFSYHAGEGGGSIGIEMPRGVLIRKRALTAKGELNRIITELQPAHLHYRISCHTLQIIFCLHSRTIHIWVRRDKLKTMCSF